MSRDFKPLVDDGRIPVADFGAIDRIVREAFDLRWVLVTTQRPIAARPGIRQAEIRRIEAGAWKPTLSPIAC